MHLPRYRAMLQSPMMLEASAGGSMRGRRDRGGTRVSTDRALIGSDIVCRHRLLGLAMRAGPVQGTDQGRSF